MLTTEINVNILVDDLGRNAILVDDGYKKTWIPRRVIKTDFDGEGETLLEVEEWFATKEGLV